MKLLVIGIDASIAQTDSAALRRQIAYYDGWDVDIVILAPGQARRIDVTPSLRVHVSGGGNKAMALWNGFRFSAQIARARMIDVVSAQDPLWCGLVAQRIAKMTGCGFHLQDHSAMFARDPFGRVERALGSSAKKIARHATRVRTVSMRGKRGLERIGVPADRIDVIPIATDVNRFSDVPPRDASAMHVLCIARLEPEKGVDVLLDAWSKVLRELPQARLRIVGGGSQMPELRRQAEARGIRASVEFAGPGKNIAADLTWATVVVQPSHFEGWGMAVVEAAAAKRPVVMTDVGCAGEVICDQQTGIVVPPNDAARLAEGIMSALRRPSEAQVFAEAAYARVQRLATPAQTVIENRQSLQGAMRHQRLMIVCQAVDAHDALFGFFLRWIREAATIASRVTVLALRVGAHDLPSNVTVLPLRSASSRSRLRVIWTLWSESWKRRSEYDAVYIRGDYQYPILAGWLWRLLGKRVILFYAHYTARPLALRIAAACSSAVVTSVRAACPMASCIPIGQAIDVAHFSQSHHQQDVPRVLSYGRISAVKRVDWMVQEIAASGVDVASRMSVIGKPTTEEASRRLRDACIAHGVDWQDRDVSYDDAPQMYAAYDVFVNATPGSLDKTIVEACLSGLVVIASTAGYREMLPEDLAWLSPQDADFGKTVSRVLALSAAERQQIAERVTSIAVSRHGQVQQVRRVLQLASGRMLEQEK